MDVLACKRVAAGFTAISLLVSGGAMPGAVAAHPADPTIPAANYGKLPLTFEVNRGQADPAVDFLGRGHGYTIFLTPAEAILAFGDSAAAATPSGDAATPITPDSSLRIQLVGASPDVRATGAGELPGRSNYLIGNDPAEWHTDIATYGRVEYAAVYQGIDLAYYGHAGQLEYDFAVSPGTDPSSISLRFEGADRLDVDSAGDLVLHTSHGEVRQRSPFTYQDIDGQRQQVASRFTLGETGLVGFDVASYDTSRPLVIDPAIVYSTYLGGSGDENFWGGVTSGGIAVDPKGNAYIAGSTSSVNFPGVTASSLQPTFKNGGMDVFVAKLDPSGSTLLYSTYLGGGGFDQGNGIAVDADGNAYITGATTSADDFPRVKAFQFKFGGDTEDAFVAKLDATGSSLAWSTFLGGNGGGWGELANGIALDSDKNVHVTGVTNSTNFPTYKALQQSVAGKTDVFVTTLSADGSALVYSTYLGGTGEDLGQAIAIDSAGNAYVTGQTTSDGLASPASVVQPTRSGPVDAFAAKFSPTGARLYSTYLGGPGSDSGWGVGADDAGNVYVAGGTGGTFPITAGWFNPTCLDPAAFVTKLNATATQRLYSGCLDALGKDSAKGLAVDRGGNAYVVGFTESSLFPTVDAFQSDLRGPRDAFVAKINATGAVLVYSSFLGGAGSDTGWAIAVDYTGHAYVTGLTGSTAKFPLQNPLQPGFGGGAWDAFVMKIDCGV